MSPHSIEPPRRVLFVLHEPGYYRFYGSTIVELERRGWQVLVAFNRPDKRGGVPRPPAGAGPGVRLAGQMPGRAPAAAAALRMALDYVRYLEPTFAHARYLRRRTGKRLPQRLRFLTRLPRVPRAAVGAAIWLGRLAERLIPIDRAVIDFLRGLDVRLVVVSPVVAVGESFLLQTDVVKAGRALGIPVITGAASWDHLTSKGLMRVVPDAVAVWNDIQAGEAEYLHRIPRSRLVVTGAQSLDHWFEPVASGAVDAFRRSLGIAAGRQVILLTGSSLKMAPGDSEVRFVERWLQALRASSQRDVREAFVIVRPHPSNTRQWQDADLRDASTVVTPHSYSGMPLSNEEVDAFRYAMLASSAVVGVNTTAMIEAAILRRPVFTVRDSAFEHSQQQTIHFGYLADEQSGCAQVAHSLDEHVAQLEALFAGRGTGLDMADRFVARFVRPRGLTTSATGHLCDAIERLASRADGVPRPVVEGSPVGRTSEAR